MTQPQTLTEIYNIALATGNPPPTELEFHEEMQKIEDWFAHDGPITDERRAQAVKAAFLLVNSWPTSHAQIVQLTGSELDKAIFAAIQSGKLADCQNIDECADLISSFRIAAA